MTSAERDRRDEEEFREQCRRQMARPIEDRMKYGFYRLPRPTLETPTVRVFPTMAEYRKWCGENLPDYLGYWPAPSK